MYRTKALEGYEPISELVPQMGMSANALRLLAHRQKVRAVLVRGRIHVLVADVEKLYEPQPYPPTARAA